MDCWPSTFDFHAAIPINEGRKRKKDRRITRDPCPVVREGSITAASLFAIENRLEWSFLRYTNSTRKVILDYAPLRMFSSSRSNRLPSSHVGVKQRAELGAQFLRTFYPDVDISADLIREELEEEARFYDSVQQFDASSGNQLAYFSCHERTRKKLLYLAFPVGDTGSELNVSSFNYNREQCLFNLSKTTVQSFQTPIRQLVGCDSPLSSQYGAYLGVRTFGVTKVLGVVYHASGISTDEMAQLLRSEVGDSPVMDMIFTNTSGPDPSLLVVTERGRVYCTPFEHRRVTQSMYKDTVLDAGNQLWRLAATSQEQTALLLSNTRLKMLDFRTENQSLDLLSPLSYGVQYLSVEGPSADRFTRAVTTSEVLWMDERYPKRPILSLRHGRRLDRTLRAQTMIFSKDPITFLTSQRHGLMSIYDVSTAEDGFVHLLRSPYFLSSSLSGTKRTGRTLLRHPSQSDDRTGIILELTDCGSLYCTDVKVIDDTRCDLDSFMPDHTEEGVVSDIIGVREKRNSSEVALRPVYERIFNIGRSNSYDKDMDVLYDILDALPTFWRIMDAPVDNMLTMFDVVLRTGQEPASAARADFFTEGILASKRGYRAVMQGRVPIDLVSKQAPWSHDLLPTLRCLVPGFCPSPQETVEQLYKYRLAEDEYRTASSIRREVEAVEQLTVDLALSGQTFSPYPIHQTHPTEHSIDDAFETMSIAAGAMSLRTPKPPPVHFGFLRPVRTKGNEHYEHDGTTPSEELCPLGGRLLLQDWTIGEDPSSYAYEDPYDSSVSVLLHPPIGWKPPGIASTEAVQRAPPIVAKTTHAPPVISSSQPQITRTDLDLSDRPVLRNLPTGSQPISSGNLPPSSQHMPMPSTQVLPGPFGGRPTVAKKRPIKKRIGGF